tara:strand:+ start:539 stop:730 length:192 start_codon:yes stop_codon:yes gene_type:complete
METLLHIVLIYFVTKEIWNIIGILYNAFDIPEEKFLRSPTGHRINRDGRIIDYKGRIKPLDNL